MKKNSLLSQVPNKYKIQEIIKIILRKLEKKKQITENRTYHVTKSQEMMFVFDLSLLL